MRRAHGLEKKMDQTNFNQKKKAILVF